MERIRFSFAEWVAGFDTRLVEFFFAIASILLGLIASDTRRDGSPVSPNLTNSLHWFSREPNFWANAMIMLGVVVLLSLALGTRRSDDTRPRAWAMFLNFGFYLSLAVSAMRHTDVGTWFPLFFGAFAALSMFCTLVLAVEAMIQHATTKLPDPIGMLDILTGGTGPTCKAKIGF